MMTTRRTVLGAAALFTTVVALTAAVPSASAAEAQAKTQLMFVQTADDLSADDKTLRLVNVGKQTIYFSDRPVRIAGHVPMSAYLKEWTAQEGPDNFGGNPPNATLSVYEGGSVDNTLAVVEISHPLVEGNDLVYNYRLLEGKMPKAGGATALFIDWIGVGGGIGPGFHGVGRGYRGFGWR